MVAVIAPDVIQGDDLVLLNEVARRVERLRGYNQERAQYYEAHRKVQDLGIAVPPHLKDIGTVVGWPGTVVDALEERLDIIGFAAGGLDVASLGVDQIWDDNELWMEYSGAHVDAFIHGITFLATSRGIHGEADPLITIESPMNMSAIYDSRGRHVTGAASFVHDEEADALTAVSLYQPNSTTHAEKNLRTGKWEVTSRHGHNLGRVTVRRLVNRPRSSRQWGRSEITRAVIHYTNAAMRSMLNGEIGREFFYSPQRWIMGADEKTFTNADGTRRAAWDAYLGHFLALSNSEDELGNVVQPKVGEFSASSPTPNIELVHMYSEMLASEAGMPVTYLGFSSENPPSADAIRAMEARHVKRAERRQTIFGHAWAGAMSDAILLRDGSVPGELRALRTLWDDAGTPTRAASTDSAVKFVGAFPWAAESDVLLETLGFEKTQLDRLKEERAAGQRRAMAQQFVTGTPSPEARAEAAEAGTESDGVSSAE